MSKFVFKMTVKWVQKHPLRIIYRKIVCQKTLEAQSDAGFRREEETDGSGHEGKSMRGANFLRLGQKSGKTTMVHLLDWAVGLTKQVVRSTFTAEGHALLATADPAKPGPRHEKDDRCVQAWELFLATVAAVLASIFQDLFCSRLLKTKVCPKSIKHFSLQMYSSFSNKDHRAAGTYHN